jgi:hypothetical protein
MTKLEEIEDAVERLYPEELEKFRAWFEALEARLFDAQIEHDIRSGKLDWLADEARAEHAKGKTVASRLWL